MLAFIQSIGNLITGVIGFVIHGIQTFLKIILMVPVALAFIVGVVATLPAFIQVFIVVSISVSAVLFVVHMGA